MKDFQVYIPTRILFGASQLGAFADAVSRKAKKLLVVTGGGSVERLGYLALCVDALKQSGCSVEIFSGIEPNPDAATINKAAAEASASGVTGVLAIGGGSAMDAAKAISALIASKEKDIWPFVAGQARNGQLTAALPLFAVPTTAATASEVTPYAVISNRAEQGKAPIAYEFLKPAVAWLNPEFTTKLPAQVTQDGASDILSHVFENYLIGGPGAPLTDRYCEAVMATVLETLPKLLNELENSDLRGTLLWNSTLALNGIQAAGRTPTAFPLHAIEHAMSAVVPDLAHGRGLATLFPAYFRWLLNNGRGVERLQQLGVRLFGLPADSNSTAEKFIEEFSGWLAENHLLQSAPSLGISPSEYPRVAAAALSTSGGSIDALGPLTATDICAILALSEQQG